MRDAFELRIEDLELAQLARKAETEFVGAPVGIMDQMACSLADESSALFIDTRTLGLRTHCAAANDVHFSSSTLASGTVTSSGEYRTRREECAASGADARRRQSARRQRSRPACHQRASRTAQSARASRRDRKRTSACDGRRAPGQTTWSEVGRLFYASHASMRDDFEMSTPVVDALVEARAIDAGVYGARLTGGGFGGAIVALTEPGTGDRRRRRRSSSHQNRRFPECDAADCSCRRPSRATRSDR